MPTGFQPGRKLPLILAVLLTTLASSHQSSSAHAATKFTLKFSKTVREKPYTGRVYIIFSKNRREPRTGPSWFRPETFLSLDVKNWKPGTPLSIAPATDKRVLVYPRGERKLDVAGYRAQAVVRFNPFDRNIGTGVGNGYSQVVPIKADADPPTFIVDKLVKPRPFRETKWVKLLKVKSKLLSKFYGRDVSMRASVRLPASYFDQPKRRYPTIYTIPGFGGTHRVRSTGPVEEKNEAGVEFLRVQLDPSCPRGHHVFADSANNGPVGEALIKEMTPAFEKNFRAIPKPTARFLTGHSSGGWSSLWLQVTYPDFFGGTWSTAPDPVDFRDFQRINLYRKGENMYVDSAGKRRPLARHQGRVLLWYKGFADMEWVLGYGGQLHSFEAVFSPKGKDGKPLLVWDRDTGKVNTDVAKTWEKYDIRLILERNWKTLSPKLKGKLHVHMGDVDTFYLEGATILLKKSLKKLDSNAVVEIHPGKDHMNLFGGGLSQRIRKEMVAAFLKEHPKGRQ